MFARRQVGLEFGAHHGGTEQETRCHWPTFSSTAEGAEFAEKFQRSNLSAEKAATTEERLRDSAFSASSAVLFV